MFVLLFILFVVGIFNGGTRSSIVKFVSIAVSPFIDFKNLVNIKKDNIFSIFRDKRSLRDERDILKERNVELEKKIELLEILGKENENLKLFLGQPNKKTYVVGSVILRPPQSPYDILVIDAGDENGIKVGREAITHSSVLIGHVAETMPKMSKIKLVSFPKEETNLILEKIKLAAIGVGLGGGNIEIKIPNSVKVEIGDNIITDGMFPRILGKVEKIETSPIVPFQKVLFRVPINLNETRYVGIEK